MKFSTIGTSWITEMFIEAAHQIGKVKLYSVYSRKQEAAARFAEKTGAEKWHTDLEELLKDSIDFVYVASPNILHYEHALACIRQGKHVFCEKPLAYTRKQVAILMDEAVKNNVFIFEGYRHLYSPNYEILKRNLNQVGEIRSVLLQYIQYSSRYDAFKAGDEPNVFSKAFAGGALMDLGVYPLSMAIDLFGSPADIDYFPVKLRNGIDGSGTLVLSYTDFHITIMCSKIAQGTIPSEIHGEEGTLTMDHIAPIKQIGLTTRSSQEIEQLAGSQLDLDMVYELTAFINMVETNDTEQFIQMMERSNKVAKWSEIARKKSGILFPSEEN
ncbi:Predicted dehydrogenase [Oceanobacillus limi]|uniref:Predicted dehydrogenase n=1 Tax=Oceanobacillus limi TaxID=930131 RepID=A0A1I0AUF2_9BACI|nr:Gfo/Idh/MocA family oxidoreductase [Oceanobacillus limi]SES98023.1 Predicted dehydrogenase [Oceanobacillus limi]